MNLLNKNSSGTDLKLLLSVFVVGFVWGTTYLGIRVAVHTIPPWVVTSIRQTLASLILFLILIYQKKFSWPGWEFFRRQLVPALLMIVLANGFTTIAEKSLPSSLAAIMSTMSPMIIFAASIFTGLQRASLKGFVGLLVGFLGVAFIFKDGFTAMLDPNYREGMLFMSIAILAWSAGVVYSKLHVQTGDNIALSLFYQFLISAVVQTILALIFSHNTKMADWSNQSILAVLYLTVFGSVITFFCYHYALKRITTTQISILNYVNTIVAIFFGWLLLDEVITFETLVATVLIIFGVVIINYKKKAKE